MSNKFYADKYEPRTEKIRKLLEDKEKETEYKLWNFAVDRTIPKLASRKTFLEVILLALPIFAFGVILPFYISTHIGNQLLSASVRLFGLCSVVVFGAVVLFYACLFDELDTVLREYCPMLRDEPYNTSNPLMRYYIKNMLTLVEEEYSDLVKDKQNSLKAYTYAMVTCESVANVERKGVLAKTFFMLACIVIPAFYIGQLDLVDTFWKELVMASYLAGSAMSVFTYFLINYPVRLDIRYLIRKNNPYLPKKTE